MRTDFEALLQFNGHKQSTSAVDVVAPSSLPADKCEPNGAHDSPEVLVGSSPDRYGEPPCSSFLITPAPHLLSPRSPVTSRPRILRKFRFASLALISVALLFAHRIYARRSVVPPRSSCDFFFQLRYLTNHLLFLLCSPTRARPLPGTTAPRTASCA